MSKITYNFKNVKNQKCVKCGIELHNVKAEIRRSTVKYSLEGKLLKTSTNHKDVYDSVRCRECSVYPKSFCWDNT